MAEHTLDWIDARLLERLEALAASRHMTLNALVLEIPARSVDSEPELPTYRDLHYLAGTWSADDEAEFLEATEPFRRVDPGLDDPAGSGPR